MPATTTLSGGALSVIDYRCQAGPSDRPFVEWHSRHSLSYVRRGSFGYHTRGEGHELVAGSVVVGCAGDEFLCSHDHVHGGDECLSFQLEPEALEQLGAEPRVFEAGALPPLAELMVLGELAQAAAGGRSDLHVQEVAWCFIERFLELVTGKRRRTVAPAPAARRRMIETALWLDANATEALSLEQAARHAGMSPYHFSRCFASVLGVTPHQYLVRCRLRRAARLLGETSLPVTDIALDVGFADLSNFVRTFRRAAGVSPGSFRRARRPQRSVPARRERGATAPAALTT